MWRWPLTMFLCTIYSSRGFDITCVYIWVIKIMESETVDKGKLF